jgi:hypothetical protein
MAEGRIEQASIKSMRACHLMQDNHVTALFVKHCALRYSVKGALHEEK